MAAVGCHMEWGQVVQGDVVYLRVVLQQKSDTVKVVSLSRHVNWRQAILGEEGREAVVREMNTEIQGDNSNLIPTSSLHDASRQLLSEFGSLWPLWSCWSLTTLSFLPHQILQASSSQAHLSQEAFLDHPRLLWAFLTCHSDLTHRFAELYL